MSEKQKLSHRLAEEAPVIKSALGFWEKYSKRIIYISAAIIILGGGYLVYKYMFVNPANEKANDAVFQLQDVYEQLINAQTDSARTALADKVLNGDAQTTGALKFLSKHSGTDAANLVHFYAGRAYVEKNDFKKAIKQLEDFNAHGATQVATAALKLLGDCYMQDGQKEKGAETYKKAGTLNEKDENFSSECLYYAGQAYETAGKTEEAIKAYQIIKDKYPGTQRGSSIDKYLARLGVITKD
ncbi:MAG: tetratricopeptide repeat protein [Sphingobacteriales bacterium]|nr:MAG: tetratricopeptide repeat protein [Sphingobacteriales bacterium]